MEWLGYILSVIIGVILGLIGGGGSILAIPILVYLFHIEPVMASAYSLFIVGMTSLIGAIPKYRDHLVNLRTGLVFGIPSIISIFITRKWIVPAIPDTIAMIGEFNFSKRLLLLVLFALLMITAAVTMIRGGTRFTHDDHRNRTYILIAEGTLIGFLTGLVGAGGGFLIIPALVLLTGLPFKTAVGTSLFIIAANSLVGFIGDVLNYPIEWRFLLEITVLAVAGIFVGNLANDYVSPVKLRRIFGWFVLATGIAIIVRELSVAGL